MPIRGIDESLEANRWIASARWIDDDISVDRAILRFTLNYRFTEAFQAGIEVNPLDERVGPLANWRILSETEDRPALIVGTSSDRIGTESGQAYYATLSKSLEPWTGIPVAPYAGASWNDRDDEWLPVGGLHYTLYDRLAVTHIWDGRNIHHTFDVGLGTLGSEEDPWGGHTLGLIVAEQDGKYFLGASYGLVF